MKKLKKSYQALIFGIVMTLINQFFRGGSLNETFWTFIGSFFGALLSLYILVDKEGNNIKYY